MSVEFVFCCRKSWSQSFLILVEDKLFFLKEQKADGKSVSENVRPTLHLKVCFCKLLSEVNFCKFSFERENRQSKEIDWRVICKHVC